MLKFATTHWVSPRFPDEYVTALRAQFAAFGHELFVLGNGRDHDRSLRHPDTFRGWWSKLEWFAPWNEDIRPAIVFDLDTFIVGNPAPFLHINAYELWLIREFLGSRKRGESGIFVAPDTPLADVIWNRAQHHDPKGADGELLREFPHRFLPDVIDGIYSYKGHQLQDACPADARVICFHGKPKPPETKGWALEYWLTSLN